MNMKIYKQDGFSFLEIMVALMILIFGLTSIFGLFGAATYSHRRSINDEMISRIATTIFSELESGQHPASLDLQNRTNQTHAQFPGIYTYDLSFVAVAGTEPTSRIVTLTVKWPKGQETFQTLLIFPLPR
jgi:Tfp pilus assembly protein PilV